MRFINLDASYWEHNEILYGNHCIHIVLESAHTDTCTVQMHTYVIQNKALCHSLIIQFLNCDECMMSLFSIFRITLCAPLPNSSTIRKKALIRSLGRSQGIFILFSFVFSAPFILPPFSSCSFSSRFSPLIWRPIFPFSLFLSSLRIYYCTSWLSNKIK